MPTTRSQSAQHIRSAIAASNAPLHTSAESSSNDARSRQDENVQSLTNDRSWSSRRAKNTGPDEPPRFVVNLSLPPEQRYLEVCAAMKDEITGLTSLFDEVVVLPVSRFMPPRLVHFFCRLLLRGVYSKEENAELRGISRATGVSMYLLVCFNVLLDLFMGCSSGGAAVGGGSTDGSATRMLHFRTLDWGMPALRRIVVQLDFVAEHGGPVVASSITYAGFVGVLTGVRKDFSISLNFRPNHNDADRFWANTLYGWHLVMVLLGFRQSIASILRGYLLPQAPQSGTEKWTTICYEQAGEMFGKASCQSQSQARALLATTACYLCFSNGVETTVVEKDRVSAKTRSNSDFIVITNNDDEEITDVGPPPRAIEHQGQPPLDSSLAEIIHEAADRKQCAEYNWNNMKVARAKELKVTAAEDVACAMRTEDVMKLVQKYPTTNESTHFACVMDAKQGKVVWCRRWIRPVTAKWIREHRSDVW